MADKSGLGRTLAEIRADLGQAPRHSPAAWAQTAQALEHILEGADESRPEEFGPLSPAQAWARLLEMNPQERLRSLAALLEGSGRGSDCLLMDHVGVIRRAEERLRALLKTVDAGEPVTVLYADGVPVSYYPREESTSAG